MSSGISCCFRRSVHSVLRWNKSGVLVVGVSPAWEGHYPQGSITRPMDEVFDVNDDTVATSPRHIFGLSPSSAPSRLLSGRSKEHHAEMHPSPVFCRECQSALPFVMRWAFGRHGVIDGHSPAKKNDEQRGGIRGSPFLLSYIVTVGHPFPLP